MNIALSSKVQDIIMVNVGIVIVAAAVFFFQVPSHVASVLAFFGCNLTDGIEYPLADYVLFFCKPCLCL